MVKQSDPFLDTETLTLSYSLSLSRGPMGPLLLAINRCGFVQIKQQYSCNNLVKNSELVLEQSLEHLSR